MTKYNRAIITKNDVKEFIQELVYFYMQDKVVGKKELSKILNVNIRTVNSYIKKGMPWFSKDTRKLFNVVECRKWLDANK